jgi:hypothetical protein
MPATAGERAAREHAGREAEAEAVVSEPLAEAFVRIRPRVDETVRVLSALELLARDVADALARCVSSLTLPALEEGDPE